MEVQVSKIISRLECPLNLYWDLLFCSDLFVGRVRVGAYRMALLIRLLLDLRFDVSRQSIVASYILAFGLVCFPFQVEGSVNILETDFQTNQTQTQFELTRNPLTVGNLSSHVVYVSDEQVSTIEAAQALDFKRWTQLSGGEFNVGYKQEGFWLQANVSVPLQASSSSTGRNISADSKKTGCL